MIEAETQGTPVVRPLLLHFGHDPVARQMTTEFMLGENILVAPVLDDSDKRDVYLPGPAEWTYLWHGIKYKVGIEGLILKGFNA
jgi:alpha-D-xyloside xylohydrolase